jgi:hypothetical protein
MTRRARRSLAAIAIVLALAFVATLAGCGGSGSDSEGAAGGGGTAETTAATTASTVAPTTTTTRPTFGSGGTPEEAIAAYVKTLPGAPGFAGDCAATQLPGDAGKYCAALTSAPAETRTYNIGPVSSEVTEKLTLEHRGAVWVVVAHEPGPRLGG